MTTKPHNTDGRQCWCNPRIVVPCQECPSTKSPNPDCWLCGGEGLVDANQYQIESEDVDLLIIHKDE